MSAVPLPLQVIGVDHRTCPDGVREKLFVDDSEMPAMLDALKARGAQEAMVLSTCNRVEVIARFEKPETSPDTVAAELGRPVGLDGAVLRPLLYAHDDSEAVRHVFRVACALDSQVVGEPQILGQVRAAHRLCRDLGGIGPVVEDALRAAYAVAKRVRSETRIGEGPVSIAAAAVARVRDLFGDLDGRSGLLAGTGELGLLIAEHMTAGGMDGLEVLDRFPRRAALAARELEAHHGGLEQLGAALDRADVVVTTLGEGRYLITAEMIEAALRRRRRRPFFLLDLSVPGDVEPAVHRLDEAFVYDVGDLEEITRAGMADRVGEATKAERMVEEAVTAFTRNRSGRNAAADIAALRAHVEAMVAEVAGGESAGDEDLARRIAARLSHAPSVVLRDLAEQGRLDRRTKNLVARLFGMPDTHEGDET
ncbi:MAG: glutamyl-tRNA reductase [Thalassobaculaceae bacterium]|nr:glutamyl-tRNA reductase [Thalassobaculaceae bacterium]